MEDISKPKVRRALPWILYQWKKADTFCALLIVIEHASLNCSVLDFRKKLSRNIRVSPIKKGICEKFRSESD
jgi:hypothetical protein